MPKFLVIGFGASGANAADTLRRLDAEAEITVLNGEAAPFYLRLDLEGIFQNKPLEQLIPRPPQYWQDRGIAVLPWRAVDVDVRRHLVTTASGEQLPYDRLLICCGAKPRDLDVPGGDLDGIFHYHTLADAQEIAARRELVKNLLVIGGGILGLEVAKAGHDYGWQVTVLVRGPFVGSPIVDEPASRLVYDALQRAGVNVLLNDQLMSWVGDGSRVTGILTRRGRAVVCDLAVVCIGVQPDVAWLESTEVLSEDGRLIVNERMETSVPDVYAAGDAAWVKSTDGHLTPCHTWNVATSQARVAAANMCGGNQLWRGDLLYNLDHLFDQEFAMIGEWDRRHEAAFDLNETTLDGEYRGLVTRDGILVGALLLGNRWADRRVRKLIAQKAVVAGRLERIFEPDAKPEDFR